MLLIALGGSQNPSGLVSVAVHGTLGGCVCVWLEARLFQSTAA